MLINTEQNKHTQIDLSGKAIGIKKCLSKFRNYVLGQLFQKYTYLTTSCPSLTKGAFFYVLTN